VGRGFFLDQPLDLGADVVHRAAAASRPCGLRALGAWRPDRVGQSVVARFIANQSSRWPITPHYFQRLPSFGVIGMDEFGRRRYGFIDPFNRSIQPVQGQGPAPALSPSPER
jgi:hypothetical protein